MTAGKGSYIFIDENNGNLIDFTTNFKKDILKK